MFPDWMHTLYLQEVTTCQEGAKIPSAWISQQTSLNTRISDSTQEILAQWLCNKT